MSNEHLGGAYPCGDGNTFMPDVWGYLLVRYQVASMLDLGCGYGHTMEWFAKLLVKVQGVEGDAAALTTHLTPGSVIAHDYTTGPAPLSDARFDLGWAAEFIEHVEERFIPHYMTDLQRCRVVCVTHAEPGQAGHHHVTLQPDDWWVSKFAEYNLTFNATETALLRLTDRWKAGWGRRTLMVFNNAAFAPLPPPPFVPLVPIYP